jgi:hypothetical protein
MSQRLKTDQEIGSSAGAWLIEGHGAGPQANHP